MVTAMTRPLLINPLTNVIRIRIRIRIRIMMRVMLKIGTMLMMMSHSL